MRIRNLDAPDVNSQEGGRKGRCDISAAVKRFASIRYGSRILMKAYTYQLNYVPMK